MTPLFYLYNICNFTEQLCNVKLCFTRKNAKMGTNAKENITNSALVDLSSGDYEPGGGFFIRANTGGTIKYLNAGHKTDAQAITKTIGASAYFIDPEYCRKIFKEGTTADQIYAGFGV
jgi:hypothetical protein